MAKNGLGISMMPAINIAPSPAVTRQYFRDQLHYQGAAEFDDESIHRYIKYVKMLNHPDKPIFDTLKDIKCSSYIIVDLWTGSIKEAWFELGYNDYNKTLFMPGIEKFKHVKINSFAQLAAFEDSELGCPPIVWMFKWHLNIVHMTREYLAGGWLERPGRVKAIEVAKQARLFLNKFGTKNIINNAKPDPLERSWYTEKKEDK